MPISAPAGESPAGSPAPRRRKLTGRPSLALYRPKRRGKVYPFTDNPDGWGLVQRLVMQSGLSINDILSLGVRMLAARWNPATVSGDQLAAELHKEIHA